MMKRFVNGIMEEPIWQKRVPQNVPEWLQTATVAFPSGRTAEELVANDAAHLVWAVNLGVIDFNPWPARRGDLDHPDELRVDLDPTPGIGWDACAGPRWSCATCSASTGCAATRRPPGPRASTSTCGSSRAGTSSRCAARRSRWPARSSAARPTWRRASGGRRSATACSSTTTRTPATAPSRPRYSVRPTPDARVSCALEWDEVPDVEPGDLRLDTVPGSPAHGSATRRRTSTSTPASLDQLHDLARRDEEGGLGDAPWPPHFPKQRGEPKRVQPSRVRDRPTHRGRAGDPQPGGPPPGI